MKNPFTLRGIKYLSAGLLLALMMTHEKTMAQSTISPMTIGLKAGLSNGYFVGKELVEISEVRHGFNAGLFANYEVSPMLNISFEVLYIKAGGQNLHPGYLYSAENEVLTDKIVNCDITMNSINFPLLVGTSIPGIKGSFKPRIYVGGDYNLCFSQKSLNTYAGNGTEGVYFYQKDESLGDRMLKNDFGFLAGTGFSFTQGKFNYIFDIRYRMGLKNLNNTESDYVDSKIQNQIISTSFGVSYNL